MRFTSLLAVLAVASTALPATGCGDLSRGELERGVASLEAISSEGRLLADDVAADRTKATFARVHARTLGDDAQHEAEKLGDATPAPGLGDERDRAVELAGEVADALGEIETAPGDEQAGSRTADALESQAKAISDLLARL